MAHTTPPGNHIPLAFEKFKELVESKSDKKIRVQIFPNAILGSDRDLMKGAQKGSLKMAVSSTPNMASFSPLSQVFDLPYITSPAKPKQFYAAIDSGPLADHFRKVTNDIGLEPIMALPFFIAAGVFMGAGGLSQRLLRLADALVGGLPLLHDGHTVLGIGVSGRSARDDETLAGRLPALLRETAAR